MVICLGYRNPLLRLPTQMLGLLIFRVSFRITAGFIGSGKSFWGTATPCRATLIKCWDFSYSSSPDYKDFLSDAMHPLALIEDFLLSGVLFFVALL